MPFASSIALALVEQFLSGPMTISRCPFAVTSRSKHRRKQEAGDLFVWKDSPTSDRRAHQRHQRHDPALALPLVRTVRTPSCATQRAGSAVGLLSPLPYTCKAQYSVHMYVQGQGSKGHGPNGSERRIYEINKDRISLASRGLAMDSETPSS
ncbi:uncharacterized protein B0T15DRAFT_201367 [Chaetomium strumarium]|uniref:Uncharacterized protein n=1 Tax=Chaetomium strumarium TaxID=1170767 RepID=A0AAJ0GTE6_9PEZI|nr:hypothetical protein B0T15DRAFT_201367 [Chaetomium strumarium]